MPSRTIFSAFAAVTLRLVSSLRCGCPGSYGIPAFQFLHWMVANHLYVLVSQHAYLIKRLISSGLKAGVLRRHLIKPCIFQCWIETRQRYADFILAYHSFAAITDALFNVRGYQIEIREWLGDRVSFN